MPQAPGCRAMSGEKFYFWTITDPLTKRRRKTRYRMTEKDAHARHGDDAQKVLEIPGVIYTDHGLTSDFLRGKSSRNDK